MKPNKPTQEHKPLVMVQSIDEKITGVSAECNCGWKIQFAPYSERSWDMAETAKQDHLKQFLPQPTVGEQTDKCLLCGEPFEGSDWVSMDGHGVGSCVDEDYYKERIASPTPIPVGEQRVSDERLEELAFQGIATFDEETRIARELIQARKIIASQSAAAAEEKPRGFSPDTATCESCGREIWLDGNMGWIHSDSEVQSCICDQRFPKAAPAAAVEEEKP